MVALQNASPMPDLTAVNSWRSTPTPFEANTPAAAVAELHSRSSATGNTYDQSAQTNEEDGDTFLAENKQKEGVRTTASGLQYKVIKEGTGPQPTENDDVVTVNYRGTFINGREFDSSYKHGRPATFQLNKVIKGWWEGLQLMKVGSKYQLFIPAKLAYGNRAVGHVIGPNSTLIFDVELLGVKSRGR